jgi:hypothetical protein
MSAIDSATWTMVNLWPERTGLPMTVHAMPRGGARHLRFIGHTGAA